MKPQTREFFHDRFESKLFGNLAFQYLGNFFNIAICKMKISSTIICQAKDILDLTEQSSKTIQN